MTGYSCMCLPEYLVYSIVNELRRTAATIMRNLEAYTWLSRGVSFPKLLMADVGEVVRCAFETLSRSDAEYFLYLLIRHISSAKPIDVEKVRECIESEKYELLNNILCKTPAC